MANDNKRQAVNSKNQVRLYAPTHISDSPSYRRESQGRGRFNEINIDKPSTQKKTSNKKTTLDIANRRQKQSKTDFHKRAADNKSVQTNTPRTESFNIHRLSKSPIEDKNGSIAKNLKTKTKQRKTLAPKQLLLYIAAAVGILGALLAGYFVFLVENIVVEGVSRYSVQDIISIGGLKRGMHMLLCDTKAAFSRLETEPYLKVLSIEREFPRTIRINIEERKEIAAIAAQGYDVFIDCEGYVLAIGESKGSNNLMRVNGMSQVSFHVNEPLGTGSDLQVRTLLTLIDQLQFYSLVGEVLEVDVSNPLRICLQTKVGISVVLGQPENISEKLAWMRDVLPSLQSAGYSSGVLDVSAKGGAIYSPTQATSFQDEEEAREMPHATE